MAEGVGVRVGVAVAVDVGPGGVFVLVGVAVDVGVGVIPGGLQSATRRLYAPVVCFDTTLLILT